jgi:hypothetical protein
MEDLQKQIVFNKNVKTQVTQVQKKLKKRMYL